MRKEPTIAEAGLWELIKAGRTGFRFQRQILLQGYIVDFYCPAASLVLEVDGSVHDLPENAAKDDLRDEALRDKGFSVLRFSNQEVIVHPEAVFYRIQSKCSQRAGVKALSGAVAGGGLYIDSSSSRQKNSSDISTSQQIVTPVAGKDKSEECGNRGRIPATVADIMAVNQAFRNLVRISRSRAQALEPDERTAAEKAFNQRHNLAEWLKTQPELKKRLDEIQARRDLESAGQGILPIFGDISPRKEVESEAATMVVAKGLHLAEPHKRQA
jgi:very-short-patch-repair endonuclease